MTWIIIALVVYLVPALFIALAGSNGEWDKLMWVVGFLWPALAVSSLWKWIRSRFT